MKVYFFLTPYHKPIDSNYQHCALCIAEGLSDLGIEINGNIDYWKPFGSNDFLIRNKTFSEEFDVAVYSASYILKHGLNNPSLKCQVKKVLIDDMDGLYTFSTNPEYHFFDLILRTHFNKSLIYLSNVVPWAFGLSNRILTALQNCKNEVQSSQYIYDSLRVNQDVRSLAKKNLNEPISEIYELKMKITDSLLVETKETNSEEIYLWNQTGRRHNLEYYSILNQSLMSYTFGGHLQILPLKAGFIHKILSKSFVYIHRFLKQDISGNIMIYQFDSWRFWESMASDSCTLDFDFEYWHWKLPINPVNERDYIGIKGFDFKGFLSFIKSKKASEISQIGQNGKQWAIENYAPEATAKRFLSLINNNLNA